jgi:hypothetical protein
MALTKMDKIRPLVDAIKQHTKQYDSGDTDYSVTTLQDPPRIVQLEKRHGHKAPFDVQSNLASFMGTAIHEYFERMLQKEHPDLYKTEVRYERMVFNRKVSGAFDLMMAEEELFDIKTTKPHNYYFNDRKHWTAQQNIYRSLIFEHTGVKLRKLNIIFWGWVWSKFDMMKNRRYPRQQVVNISLPVWSIDRTNEYIENRVQTMIDSETMSDVDLPYCTSEDYWGDPDVFAVHRTDRKNALRLIKTTRKDAQDWMNTYQQESEVPVTKLYIENRPGKRKRCEDWCGINNYCNQWTDYCSMKKGN